MKKITLSLLLFLVLFSILTSASTMSVYYKPGEAFDCSWAPGSWYLKIDIIDNGAHLRFTNTSQTTVTFISKAGNCVASLSQDLAPGKSTTLLSCGARYSSDVTCYAMPSSEFVYGKCPLPIK